MIGEQIANFRILDKLGEGGMGVVYKAMDVHLERPVAIKVLAPELARNPEIVERFRTEARAQANLNHANLATLYAFLVQDDKAFIVMEFVEGENFEQLIRRRGPLPPEDAIPWFKQALLGVGAAHRMGIVHRDIKPTNLMLNRQGLVKVMDFGIAKVLGVRGATRTGMQLGTPAYMSPEQIQGRGVDVRSDIYALGITLYQMLSGHVPFEEGSDFEIMRHQVSTPPPPLVHVHPYAPVVYEGVVMKAIEKDPNCRYRSVEEFGAALERPESVSLGALPAEGAALKRTVLDTASGTTYAGAAAAPQLTPVPATRIDTSTPLPVAAASGRGWNSRYLVAGLIGIAAVAVLGFVLLTRKPAAPPVSATGGTGGSSNTPLVSGRPQVEMNQTGSGLDSILQGTGGAGGQQGGQGTTQQPPPSNGRTRPHSSGGGAQNEGAGTDATPPPPPPAEPQPSQADFDKLEHEIDQLTTRAAAVNGSLDNMKQQQAASGLSLRSDIATRQASMQLNLSKAQAAIEQHDLERAKRYADLTSADLQLLEHFLGR